MRSRSCQPKILHTAVVYYCNLALGVSATFFAPILVHFRNAFHTDTQNISYVLTTCRVIVLVSALSFGWIFNHVNRHLTVTFLVLLMGLTAIALPFSMNLTHFGILSALQALAAGGYLTAQVVWIIELWKDSAGPFIQAQHFFFALGCIFPPLIFAPYLSSMNGRADLTESPNETQWQFDLPDMEKDGSNHSVYSLDQPENAIQEEIVSLEKLYVPCAICGSVISAGAVFLVGSFLAGKSWKEMDAPEESANEKEELPSKDTQSIELSTDESRDMTKGAEILAGTVNLNENLNEDLNESSKKSRWGRKVALVTLASCLIGAVESMEGITMSFLPTYAHFSHLHLSEAESAQLLSAYSLAYTVVRGLGILLILKVPAQWILSGNLALVIAANVVLLLGRTQTLMYVGSALLGAGFSTSVPSVFAYVQLSLRVTNVVGSILMVAGASLAAVFPVVVGSFIEGTPKILLYVNLSCVGACALCLVAIICVMRGTSGKL